MIIFSRNKRWTRKFPLLFTLLFVVFSFSESYSQSTQTVKGMVVDKQTEIPVIGATVELLTIDPVKGTVTDVDGEFKLEAIPVGRHELRISYLGYNTITLPNILLTSGKEVILEIGLEESVLQMDEVVVTAEVEKDKANNELATISARSFTLEEVTRYSGGINDVSRMVSNFAGVSTPNDNRNDIVIRGNSPTGVLWRLEGVPIPNPNHFSTLGSTGGPINALNTNLLKNSDFMTSAFPAEYGNANAGVFDIQFRSGNKDNYEVTAQMAAFNGLELMVEGPLSKKKNSSFVASYRHSFVELATRAGVNIGTASTPNYNDFAFKLDFANGKLGKFSFFGLGGLSDIAFLAKDADDADLFGNGGGVDSYATSTLGMMGMTHRYLLNDKTYVKSVILASTSQNDFNEDRYNGNEVPERYLKLKDVNDRYSVSSFLNRKFNARHTLRTGILYEWYALKSDFEFKQDNGAWIPVRDFNDGLGLLQLYAQSQYKPNEKLTINTGLHFQYLDLNGSTAIEPRVAFNYHFRPNQTLSLGYGLHNQMQALPFYLNATELPDGSFVRTNEGLDFTQSNHFVLGYDWKLGTDWRVKAETYYQFLNQVPVDSDPTNFSVLNIGDDFGFPRKDFLVNEGTGENYGVELTIEKFFSKGYYALLTTSVYDSNYEASDGIKRNTSFNNSYILNVLGGKEWAFGKTKNNAITFDMNLTYAGGRYYIPIDLEASRQAGEMVRDQANAYTVRHPDYFRLDAKVGYRLNSTKRKFSQTFYLDFRNLTNNKNVFTIRYNENTENTYEVYQIGFFPDVMYRAQF